MVMSKVRPWLPWSPSQWALPHAFPHDCLSAVGLPPGWLEGRRLNQLTGLSLVDGEMMQIEDGVDRELEVKQLSLEKSGPAETPLEEWWCL